jgi:hydrogenase maturation protease
MTERRALAIGVGNPLRSDDGVGWHVVEVLMERAIPGIEGTTVHQLTPELAELLRNVERVAFIDAAVDEGPGRIGCRRVVAEPARLRGSHGMAPGELLGLAERLGIQPAPEARLFTVGAQSLDHGSCLSEIVDQAVERARALVAVWLQGMD